jgi:hypothetical protein
VRPSIAVAAILALAGCTISSEPTTSGSTGSDGGTGASADAGTGGGSGSADAGTGGGSGSADAGGGSGGGGSGGGDGGSGGGTASDCDGLTPAAPGAASSFRVEKADLTSNGFCTAGQSEGTGYLWAGWGNGPQSRGTFFDPNDGSAVGTGGGQFMIPEASGFIGSSCSPSICSHGITVYDPTGKVLYDSGFAGYGAGGPTIQNDPTGGVIHAYLSDPLSSPGTSTVTLEARGADGKTRWSHTLPDTFRARPTPLFAADREGNVLVIWNNGASARWLDHSGTPGPIFTPGSNSASWRLFERVGSGLFLDTGKGWMQIDAGATAFTAAPSWLATRSGVSLHMVHGGRGYAVIPDAQSSTKCEQPIEVVSPSGQSCGTATFAIDSGGCQTNAITVGYDGTVVQQMPYSYDAANCTAAGHECPCTYRYWRGFFR